MFYLHVSQTLSHQRDRDHNSIVKTRRCFLWNKQYFQLDIFKNYTKKYVCMNPSLQLHTVLKVDIYMYLLVHSSLVRNGVEPISRMHRTNVIIVPVYSHALCLGCEYTT